MDCSLLGSSVHRIFQATILEGVAISSPGDLPNPGIKPGSPELQRDTLPSEPPGKIFLEAILTDSNFTLKVIVVRQMDKFIMKIPGMPYPME